MRTSENAVKAKFAFWVFSEVASAVQFCYLVCKHSGE